MAESPHTDAGLALEALIAKNLRSDLRLGRYLRGLAQATVLGLALGACGQSHAVGEDGGTDARATDSMTADTWVEPWPDPAPCPPGPSTVDPLLLPSTELCEPDRRSADELWNPLPLFAEQGFDYAAVGTRDTLFETGVACSGAEEVETCLMALDALFEAHGDRRGLYFTRGVEVRFVDDRAELIEMFGGRISVGDQALFMLYLEGELEISCEPFPAGAEEAPGGWRATAYRTDYDDAPWTEQRIQSEYFIHALTGEVSLVEERLVAALVACGGGRRPAGLAPAPPRAAAAPLGAFFADMAWLEESSVSAFDVMASELERLGAPALLLERTRQARADEVRHTDSMSVLARAFGVEPARPEISPPTADRTRFEIALENAVEGCVRETYGALVGAHQALHARDPRIRTAMQTVAADEIRHAELSWALAGWLEPQLTDEERQGIAAAKRQAVAELRGAAGAHVDASLVERAGLPEPRVAAALVATMARDIWA